MSLRLLLSITNWVRYGGTVVRYDGTVTVVRWYGGTVVRWYGTPGTVLWYGGIVHWYSTVVQLQYQAVLYIH